jgi:hypothetical protein
VVGRADGIMKLTVARAGTHRQVTDEFRLHDSSTPSRTTSKGLILR